MQVHFPTKRSLWVLAFTLAFFLCGCGQSGPAPEKASTAELKNVTAILDAFGAKELSRSPETSSRLGLPPAKAGYLYNNLLDDRSQAEFERIRLERLETLERLERIDAGILPRHTSLTLQVTRSSLQSVIEMSTFGHGQVSLGFSRPFAADQLSGAYIDLPDLFINRQFIRSREEAIDYIDRLGQMAGAIDDDRRRLVADAEAGVRPPDFILQRMTDLSKQFYTPLLEERRAHPILVAFENLSLGAAGLNEAERAQMKALIEQLIREDINPAYARFAQTLESLKEAAPETPGIWAIRNGDQYYEAALKFYTGEALNPGELHNQGLEIVARLSSELDIALQEAGFESGTIYERLEAINTLPGQIFENTPEGKAALLQSLRDRINATQSKLSSLITSPPRAGLRVDAIPDFLSINAPGAYYAAAPADDTVPAIFFINLRDTSEWPAYTLPTLLYHEAIPGHHFESALTSERGNLPILRKLIWLPVYGEGWALYAEDLANEIGVYADDPLGKVGYLQSLLFRAARLVTDTGIHYQRWSRTRAVDYLVETTGQSRTAMESEVDRYAVWPGQAVAYMVGRQFIWEQRQRSQQALGVKFDLPSFHDAILSNGPRPLHLIEADIDDWIIAQKRK